MTTTEIIFGKHAVLELLRAGKRRCHNIWIVKGKKEKITQDIENLAVQLKIPIKLIKSEEAKEISKNEKHHGIIARVDSFPYSSVDDVLKVVRSDSKKGFLLILDGILDPQNLGSIIRTACLSGVHGVIIPKDNSAAVTPAVLRASSGATEYLPIAQVTNLVSQINYLKNNSFWIIAAVGDSGKNLYHFDFTKENYVLVLGGEGKGVRRLVRENCDEMLSIPMVGKISSYNVSVAGAIFMLEVMRQRSNPLKTLDKFVHHP